MTEPFFLRALFAALGLSLAAGPLGCLIVWRRMAFFGDALAHGALLGLAVAMAAELPLVIGAFGAAAGFAFLLHRLEGAGRLSSDTVLGLLSHAALSVGLLIITAQQNPQFDVSALLFGDLLSVGPLNVALLWALALGTALLFWRRADDLILWCLQPEIAAAEGLAVERLRLGFALALALVVAFAIKVVGLLLVASLLILPPAAARLLANAPRQMALFASVLGVLACLAGMAASWTFDLPPGPVIASLCAGAFFALFAARSSVAAIFKS